MPLLVSVDIGKYSPAENLALNEACLNYVRRGEPILRVFTFSEPGAILAKHESIWDVREHFHNKTTRRHTGGSVVYVDENTLGYTVLFDIKDLEKNGIKDVYRLLTNPLVDALKERGLNASLGGQFSIRVDGKVIAGHSQYKKKNQIQYDGLIHLRPPDLEKVENSIKLRTLASDGSSYVLCIDGQVYDMKGNHLGQESQFSLQKKRDERTEISQMPGLSTFGLSAQEYLKILRSSFEKVFGMESIEANLQQEIVLEANMLERTKYRSHEWVSSGKSRALGHCFVDLVEPEQIIV